jgi:hypothetical protein
MPHLKKLTVTDLAKCLSDDEPLKKKLVEAILDELKPEGDYAELEPRLLDRFNRTLLELAVPPQHVVTTYHVTCASCDLNKVVEAVDWRRAGIRIECCVCGNVAMLSMPENERKIPCSVCGVETHVKRVNTVV